MRILVVDDIVTLQSGVARATETDGHEVTGVMRPAHLKDLLANDSDYQLAFVDIDYGANSSESGLAALETLEKYDIPSVIYCADAEVNRLLYILAAFEFFPQTCTFLSKHAGDLEVHRVVTAIAQGNRPHDKAAQRYRPPRNGMSFLRQLITRSSDLALWRALSTHSTLSLVAQAANVSPRTVSSFIADRQQVIANLHHEMLDLPIAPPTPEGGRQANLLEVCRFARPHEKFFRDNDVERLVRLAWDPVPRRSAGARAGDAHRRKRT
ncbi:response regulator [Streptomyces griseoincarnatus]